MVVSSCLLSNNYLSTLYSDILFHVIIWNCQLFLVALFLPIIHLPFYNDLILLVSFSLRNILFGQINSWEIWSSILHAILTGTGISLLWSYFLLIIAWFSVTELRLRLHFQPENWTFWISNIIFRQEAGSLSIHRREVENFSQKIASFPDPEVGNLSKPASIWHSGREILVSSSIELSLLSWKLTDSARQITIVRMESWNFPMRNCILWLEVENSFQGGSIESSSRKMIVSTSVELSLSGRL